MNDFNENGNYLMLAFDHRDNFKKYINSKNPEKVIDGKVVDSIKNIIESLKDDFSGILLDSQYSLPAFRELQIQKPFLLPAEKSNGEKITILDKSSKDIKNAGGSGVKLLIYFDPNSETAEPNLLLLKKFLDEAHEVGIPLFLTIISDDMRDPERVLRSVEYFLKKNVIPDVFVLEFPGSDYLCRKVSNMLGSIPWIMISGGADYILFREQLIIATENDCRGFIAGRSLWQEYFDIAEPERKRHFLEFTLPLRFKEIKEIIMRS